MGLVAYVLWQLRDRVRPGVLFALYLVIAGARALPDRVHPPQRRRRAGTHGGPAREPGAVRHRGRLARRGRAARRPAARRRAGAARARRAAGDLNQGAAGAAVAAAARGRRGGAGAGSGCGAASAGGAGADRAAARRRPAGPGARIGRRRRRRARAAGRGRRRAGCGGGVGVGGVGLSWVGGLRRGVGRRRRVVRRRPRPAGWDRRALGGRRRLGRGRRGRRVDGRAGGHVAIDRAGGRVAGLGHGLGRRGVSSARVASASALRPDGAGRLAADTGRARRRRRRRRRAPRTPRTAGRAGSGGRGHATGPGSAGERVVGWPTWAAVASACARRAVGPGEPAVPASGPEPVTGAAGRAAVGRPGRPIAGAPAIVVGCAANEGRPAGWEAACGGASRLTGVRGPCALGQASRKGRMSLRSSARQVPISAKAMIAPESHARVARVRPGPSRIILDGTSTRKGDHSSPRKGRIARRKADRSCVHRVFGAYAIT